VYRVEPLGWPAGAGQAALEWELGLRYRFTLSSAVEECEEFVMPSRRLRELCGGMGLGVAAFSNFGAFVSQHLGEHGHLLPTLKVGPLSDEEWEAVTLYAVVVLRQEEMPW
jgi:hypothetical protein